MFQWEFHICALQTLLFLSDCFSAWRNVWRQLLSLKTQTGSGLLPLGLALPLLLHTACIRSRCPKRGHKSVCNSSSKATGTNLQSGFSWVSVKGGKRINCKAEGTALLPATNTPYSLCKLQQAAELTVANMQAFMPRRKLKRFPGKQEAWEARWQLYLAACIIPPRSMLCSGAHVL